MKLLDDLTLSMQIQVLLRKGCLKLLKWFWDPPPRSDECQVAHDMPRWWREG